MSFVEWWCFEKQNTVMVLNIGLHVFLNDLVSNIGASSIQFEV